MIIIWLIITYFAITACYLLAFSLASLKKPETIQYNSTESQALKRIALLIPVYRSDETILETAQHALQLQYPKQLVDVIVIADSLQEASEEKLKLMGCRVIKMTILPRSKAKAINFALSQLPANYYDICAILDADNWLSTDSLLLINQAFVEGARAIQGIRIAKSVETPIENLEAISEAINNNLFRRGHQKLGLPAALAGSGMAFQYDLFKEVMLNIDATNGFDKDLEFEIISRNIHIQFLEQVKVYDEKVSSLEVLQNQRKRWFAAQIINIGKGLKFVMKNPSLGVLDKWWQMFLPSRLLLMAASIIFILLLMVLGFQYEMYIMSIASLVLGTSLILATPKRFLNKQLFESLKMIPSSILALSWSMLAFTQAFKGFIHTPHSSIKK